MRSGVNNYRTRINHKDPNALNLHVYEILSALLSKKKTYFICVHKQRQATNGETFFIHLMREHTRKQLREYSFVSTSGEIVMKSFTSLS